MVLDKIYTTSMLDAGIFEDDFDKVVHFSISPQNNTKMKQQWALPTHSDRFVDTTVFKSCPSASNRLGATIYLHCIQCQMK